MGKFGLCNYGYIPQPHTNAQGWADGSSLGVKVIGTLMGIVQMANVRNKNLVKAIMMLVDENWRQHFNFVFFTFKFHLVQQQLQNKCVLLTADLSSVSHIY